MAEFSCNLAKASIIILNYNGKSYLENCLKSLEEQTYKNMEVILVDNASIDGSVEYVEQKFPWVKIVRNSRNLGFAEGNNRGVKYATGEYVVFLNNDTVVDKYWLENLIIAAESDPTIGICGSKILFLDKKDLIQELGGLCDIYGSTTHRYCGEIDKGQYDFISDVFYVSGASLLIKRKVLKEIGGFDPIYFMYHEDVDLCWRAQLAGYRVVVVPTSKVYHKGGGSLQSPLSRYISGKFEIDKQRKYFTERNTLITLLKNYSLKTLLKILPRYLALISAEIGLYIVSGRFDGVIILLKAQFYVLKNIKYILFQREKISKIRKVNDAVIIRRMIKKSIKILKFRETGLPKFV